MKAALTALLMLTACSLSAQPYTFPNIDKPQAEQIRTVIDTLFAGISRGHIPPGLITGTQEDLSREMLEYLQNRQGPGVTHEIINCYSIDSHTYRVMIACNKADTLQQICTFDVRIAAGQGTVDLPLWHDTRNWPTAQAGTLRYRYDHDFDTVSARAFDAANRRIAGKLNLPVDSFNFYLADNYQQIMQWLGLTYDRATAGQSDDGFNIEQTIFAIQHNEDFSHDLVHYYVYKIRKGPRNPYAEEGVAYYWGNAYYPDAEGHLITLDRLKKELRVYLAAHQGVDLLTSFRQNQRGVFGPVKQISMRSTLSGVIAETVEQKYGVDGVIKLLNCGAGEANYFKVTQSLIGINADNFNQEMLSLLTQ
jgi:hypothetical protein